MAWLKRPGEDHWIWRRRVLAEADLYGIPNRKPRDRATLELLGKKTYTRTRYIQAWADLLAYLPEFLAELEEDEEDERRGPKVTVENGRAMWWSTIKRPLRTAEARVIADGLAPELKYSLYYRMESYAEHLDRDGSENPRGDNAVLGLDRGKYVDKYWNHSTLVVNHEPVHYRKGRDLSSGDIKWIDEEAWESAAGYVKAYYFALIPRGTPSRRWLSMRDGAINCVVERVREALAGKRKGLTLTPARAAILDVFAREFTDQGCDEGGLQRLASALKIKLVVRDVDGATLWRPTDRNGKATYENQMEVTIYRQNGHAYAGEPQMPYPTRSAMYDVPESVKDTEALRLCQLTFLRDQGAGRAWTVGAEIVTEEGVVYRPPGMEEALNLAMGEHGESVDIAVTHLTRLGGVRAYRFGKWLELNRIGHLTPKWRDIWRDSVVEARVWNCLGEVAGTKLLDMSAAYLGCGEDAAENAVASVYARRHGFPGAAYQLYRVESLEAVRALAGTVHIVSWSLSVVHPAVARILVGHLERHAWLPIPLALYLQDTGRAALTVDRAAICMDRLQTLKFPRRDLAVVFIGSCMRNKRKNSLITRDEAECDFYVDKFLREDRAPVPRHVEGLYQVEYDAGERKDRSHIRAYVLAYMQIAVIDALGRFGADDVVYCCVDGIRVRPGVAAPEGLPMAESSPVDPPHPKVRAWRWDGGETTGERPPPGLWRWKEEGEEYNYHESHAQPPLNMHGSHAALADEGIELPSDEIARAPVTFLDGQGGSGKSYRALRAFPGRRVVILCHNNEYAIDVAKDAEKNPYGYPTRTYHEYLHLGNEAHTEWTEQKMGRERPDVIFWDEIGLVNVGLLERVLPWMRKMRAQVVLAGDPSGQLPNFEEEKVETGSGERLLAWLRVHCDQTVVCEEDHRAKEEGLKELKRGMWRATPADQYRSYRTAGFVTMTPAEAVAAWTPADTFVASTTGLRDTYGRMVANQEPDRVRLRFAPKGTARETYRKRKGKLPKVVHPGTGELVPAAVGSVIEVVGPPLVAIDSSLWAPAYASTVHGLQGRTVKAPGRLFVVESGLTEDWCPNIIYTIVSRVEHRAQIIRVGA
jgi:hypothetical protein